MSSIGSSLADSYCIELLARRTARSKTPARAASPSPSDTYAPAPEGCTCTDRTGYQRRRHTFDRDGRCVFCDRRTQ
jgi:hypothetical protein